MTTATFDLKRLGNRQLSALRRKAKLRGISADDYVGYLVEEALTLETEALKMTWEELVEPIQKSLGRLTDKEIDALVEKARGRKSKRTVR